MQFLPRNLHIIVSDCRLMSYRTCGRRRNPRVQAEFGFQAGLQAQEMCGGVRRVEGPAACDGLYMEVSFPHAERSPTVASLIRRSAIRNPRSAIPVALPCGSPLNSYRSAPSLTSRLLLFARYSLPATDYSADPSLALRALMRRSSCVPSPL